MKFFSDICTECLNPQVRVNKMANILPPQFLELTSKAHPLIFLWTRKGFEFSSEFSLNFFSNLYMAPRLRKSFNFMVLGLLKKMHLWVKKNIPKQHPLPVSYHYYSREEEITHFSKTMFFVFLPSRKGGGRVGGVGGLRSWKNDQD